MPDIKPELSIIIVSFNTEKLTLQCIKSIINSNISVPYEIIVVDNDSKDKTLESIQYLVSSIKNTKLHITSIKNKDNVGFAKANNQGVKMAQGKYILFLNSDTIILDNAINTLFDYFKKHPEIHFLGPKLFNVDKTPQASCARFYSLPIIFGALFLKGDYWGLTRWSPNTIQKVDWVSGACILTKKEYFESLHGFDEQIFMYMDEVDLLYRARKERMNTYAISQAEIIHLGSASSSGKTYPILQVYKGFLYFYQKHYDRFENRILKIMLQLKAYLSIIIGLITNNSYLKKTYAEALKLVR